MGGGTEAGQGGEIGVDELKMCIRDSNNTEDGVGEELGGILERGNGNAEEGFAAQEPAYDHYARNGGEDYGTEDTGAPAADDFFNHKQNRRYRRVEGGS